MELVILLDVERALHGTALAGVPEAVLGAVPVCTEKPSRCCTALLFTTDSLLRTAENSPGCQNGSVSCRRFLSQVSSCRLFSRARFLSLPYWMGAGESELQGAIYRADTRDIMPRAHKCTCKLASL